MGAATARCLAAQGARVALADVNFEEVKAVAAEIGSNAGAFQVDVARIPELRTFVAAVASQYGRIDVLVNNAGICPRLSFAESTEADWEKLMNINARSQYFLMQAVCPIMKKQGGGRIINLASTGGRVGAMANASIYSGTKGAIVMFSKSVAREVAGDGIYVNCIAPGVMDTDLIHNLPPDKVNALRDQIPLKRIGKPAEVAAFVAFLASEECSYCTGATFDVNGGWIMV